MGYPDKFEPCPEFWMSMENPKFTICEVLREIWQKTDDPKIRMLTRIAMTMSKKMGAKLRSYKDGEELMNAFDDKTDEMRKFLDREDLQNG